MPPTSSKPPPLPLAPDRAEISNKISLLISNRTRLLRTLNPTSTCSSTSLQHNDEVERLFSGSRPNEGLGYVSDRGVAGGDVVAREDKVLRGRLMGKMQRSSRFGTGKKVVVESESDEEPGRSGLGKRKRPRRDPVVEVEVEEGEEQGKDEAEDEEMSRGEGEGDEDVDAAVLVQERQDAITDQQQQHNGNDDAKRNKKKRKRQRGKEKQKQKKLDNAS